MARYKCTRCGTESPHNKTCFYCGNKIKNEIKGPDFAVQKSAKKKIKISRHLKGSVR
jgi:ribosomal protein L37E